MAGASGARPGLAEPHAREAGDALAALVSGEDGLAPAEAARRLAEVGPNRLPAPVKDNAVVRFLRHFHDVLIYILLASAALKAFLGEWVDVAVILGVAVINAVIGFVQEGRADRALEGIRSMLSVHAQVRRGGEWTRVDAEDLVPGDVIRVGPGDRVPADARLLGAVSLRVEEAALTGESLPAEKQVAAVAADAGIGDRSSMLFSGSIVAAGQGTAVVTATGPAAEIGRIQTMLQEVEGFDTPLTRQLTAFGRVLSVVILAMTLVMLVIGWTLHGFTGSELVSAAIGFAVAAIPEGLPALVTITLALGVQQMARRNAIVRRLPAVETLGSVTTICSDKTGTLTKNEMTVREVATRAGRYLVHGLGYEPDGRVEADGAPAPLAEHPDLRDLATAMAVPNDADVAQEDGRWRLLGEPTEGALRTLGLKCGVDHHAYARIAVVPFDSADKLMATLNTTPAGDVVVFVKGAPDRLLDRSVDQRTASGGTEALDRGFWEGEVDALSGEGLRVLAAAMRPAGEARTLELADLDDGLTFLGLAGIVDPPRPDAIAAIATCRRAGIQVKMITGDHAGTAAAIAAEMGIADGSGPPAVTGAELEGSSDEDLRRLVAEADTFARTSPEHKLRLVTALQANGEVVAMTGDGVNDAPALKRADVGVAMGIKGTEATKEAAAVVLTDDNFASIERAVEEGRRIYDNLQKSIVFLLPTNGAQSLVILVAVLLGLPLPLDPVQILWVNMVTAVTLSLALAYEPAEPDVMTRPPRRPGGSILHRRYLPRIALASVLIAGAALWTFEIELGHGVSVAVAQTTAVNTLVVGQAAYLVSSRFMRTSSFRREALTGNPVAWLVVGVLLLLQLLFVYVPALNSWFGSAPVGPGGWVLPIVFGVAILLVVEAGKVALRGVERGAS
jgi:magnesium-transporting ATPase (P-type)